MLFPDSLIVEFHLPEGDEDGVADVGDEPVIWVESDDGENLEVSLEYLIRKELKSYGNWDDAAEVAADWLRAIADRLVE